MRTKKCLKVVFSSTLAIMSALLMQSPAIAAETSESGMIVDGANDDWIAMGRTASNELKSLEWQFAKSEDGSELYFYFAGPVSTQWEYPYDWKYIEFKVNDTTIGVNLNNMVDRWILPGAEIVVGNTAGINAPGICVYEGVLPIMDDNFTISFDGNNIAGRDIPTFIPTEEVEAVYEGIKIDGSFYDWAAVEKTEAGEEEDALNGIDCLKDVACIFDGDYVYIYFRDGEGGTAANAGTHSNGRYSIVTDTGRILTFEVKTENRGSVANVVGTVKYFEEQWEIAIPASELPLYSESFSFGLYQQEPMISGIMNLQGGAGTAGDFSGIEYDGMFGDWNAYPHTLIQYATSGTNVNNPDGEGALYTEDGMLYGHVVSSMPAHLAEDGGEFASAVSIYFNGDHDFNHGKTNNLYPYFVAVASDGTINWSPQTSGLEEGTYTFYISDGRVEIDKSRITNVSQLAEHEKFFGEIIVNIKEDCDEMEFYIDLEQVAKFLSHYSGTKMEASDFKLIEAQFGRIGQEILSVGGTSSGPYMGIAICVVVVAVALLKRRRNKAVA